MKKILVVDDSDYILESTSVLLSLEGYEVYTATNGEEGFQKALEVLPDLILCDIQMPIMDGYTMLEKIRSNPKTEFIPFIFLTAFGEKQNIREGMIRGADDYITKPFTHQEIIEALNTQWKKLETLKKQVKEKVESVGRAISFALPHEFRTVLNEVIGSAKFILSSYDDLQKEDILEIASDIVRSSNRLMKITENFLIYSKIEALANNPEKKSQLRLHFTDEPYAIIQDIATIKSETYGRTNDLVFEKPTYNLSLEISSDSFYKIVDELIDNALKFSEKGQKVKISSGIEKGLAFFEIEDEGRGISKDKLKYIDTLTQFEREVYEQQGVGMGLVIAKRLVELHDGRMEIKSEVGKGTKIKFLLHYQKKDNY
ncbi:MAG: hybrid sensor histidine kinase/response regulator [Ignavibacteria bacterium]|nr:hybrid sensor histidine kinase/response regulator [Ignavibacteria bacterium]